MATDPTLDLPQDVQEGEVVSEAAPAAIDLTGLINTHLSQITGFKDQLSKLKEMLDDVFVSDPTYQTHDAAVKEATKIRGQTKKQIQKLPQVIDLTGRIADLKASLKEHNAILSDYLQQYHLATGSNTFETEDGQIRQIVYSARLVSSATLSK